MAWSRESADERFMIDPIPTHVNSEISTGSTPVVEKRRGDRRKVVVDRRDGSDRRDETETTSTYDRRRGPGRRRTDYRRDAEEGHMNEEQLEFLKAIDEYKRVNGRPFPTWTEVLDLVLFLGYRKVAAVGRVQADQGSADAGQRRSRNRRRRGRS